MAAAGVEAVTYMLASKFFQQLKIHITNINFTFSNNLAVQPDYKETRCVAPDTMMMYIKKEAAWETLVCQRGNSQSDAGMCQIHLGTAEITKSTKVL